MGRLAAQFGTMTFTRALGYAKRPLLPAAGNAGSRQRLICTKFTGFISLWVELRLILQLETALLVRVQPKGLVTIFRD